MCGERAITGTLFVLSFVALAATGQQGTPSPQTKKVQLENCQAAMPVISKNYNDAKYAVQRARNSADASHILPAVNEAQLALEAMEQPLKVCTDAVQSATSTQSQDNKN